MYSGVVLESSPPWEEHTNSAGPVSHRQLGAGLGGISRGGPQYETEQVRRLIRHEGGSYLGLADGIHRISRPLSMVDRWSLA